MTYLNTLSNYTTETTPASPYAPPASVVCDFGWYGSDNEIFGTLMIYDVAGNTYPPPQENMPEWDTTDYNIHIQDYITQINAEVIFDCTDSLNLGLPKLIVPTGITIVEYSWDFGNGYTGQGPIASTTFTQVTPDGACTLTVTDNLGRKVSTTKRLNFVNLTQLVPSFSRNSSQTSSTVAAPTNTALPTISGTPQVGSALVASDGSWSGTGTITYTFQWAYSGGGNIPGATSANYTPQSSDVGKEIYVIVTASNASSGGGTTSANSAATTPITASSSTTYQVNAEPTGPSVPTAGWEVVAADAFNPNYSLSNLWYPTRGNSYWGNPWPANEDMPGYNSNEVEVFNESQLSLNEEGVKLEAICFDGTKNYTITGASASPGNVGGSYRSGAFISDNYYTGAATNGFNWKPTAGVVICFESVITLPTIGGADVGWWTSTGSGSTYEEIDYFEQQNWTSSSKGAQYPSMAINNWFNIGNSWTGEQPGLFAWDNAAPWSDPVNDGKQHRWTTVFDGVNQVMSMYIDGVAFTLERPDENYAKVSSVGIPWPSAAPKQWQFILYSFGIRDTAPASGSLSPPYVVGQGDTCTIQSFAAYVNADATLSSCIKGGGIAAGTAANGTGGGA